MTGGDPSVAVQTFGGIKAGGGPSGISEVAEDTGPEALAIVPST